MARKSYFNERTPNQIKQLNLKSTGSQKNLVQRIMDIDPETDALEIRARLTPGRFFRNTDSGNQASRKNYKHGNLISLSQPKTQHEAYSCSDIPLAIRARDFSQLESIRQEEINFIGYSWYPVQGNDRRKRIVPFVWLPEAVRLFGYAENMAGGIKIEPYADAERVKKDGASIICSVPSRSKKKGRYRVRLMHVPMDGVTERRAAVWSLKSEYSKDSPEHQIYNIRYTWADERENSDVFTFYPQDIAAYIAVIKESNSQHNLTPFEMSPLALVSRKEADFYTRLCNNVVIFDPTISSKEKLRKLHLDEKCMLIARSIGVFGHDESMYWNPSRDGMLKEYDWQPKKEQS